MRRPRNICVVFTTAFTTIAIATWAPVLAIEDWPKVHGLSYLEMPDEMYNAFFNTLSWCRASVETPEERLEHLRGGFPEEEAKDIVEVQQKECVRDAGIRMRNARSYGYVGEKEAVFDAAFWARLDEARENLK